MGLENTLDAREEWKATNLRRDPARYYLSIFGQPDAQKPWGWRYEGHHVSLNYTIVGGQIVAPTPTFFGANPAESHLGSVATLRPLAGTEDLARELVHALDESQRHTAVLTSVAPADIVLRNRPYIEEDGLHLDDPAEIEKWMAESGISAEAVDALRYRTAQPSGLAVAQMAAFRSAKLSTS